MKNRRLSAYTLYIAVLALAAVATAAVHNRTIPLSRALRWIAGAIHNPAQQNHDASQREGESQGNGGSFTNFDVTAAGTSALEGTIGWGINASGVVVGSYIDSNNVTHGFMRSAGGTITTFDAPGAGTSATQGTIPLGIDAAGNITGFYADSNNAYHGFLLPAGQSTFTTFDEPSAGTTGHRGTVPISISGGVITGTYVTGSVGNTSVYHGFVRTADGTITSFDPSGAGTGNTQGTQPTSINSAGVITGGYRDANSLYHVFIRNADGTFNSPIDAPSAAGLGTVAGSIDAAGDITGTYTDSGGVFHGFILPAGGAMNAPISAPGASTTGGSGKGLGKVRGTLATTINSTAGLTAGLYTDTNDAVHCFLLPTGGSITAPVDDPSAGSSALQGTSCFGVSDSGTVVGTYADADEVLHGFILTPSISPPQAATPTFSPAPGSYNAAQNVTISDATTGATIYYTTNGQPPTTDSPVYSTPIPVNSTETIEAMAAASGYANSNVAVGIYSINTSPTYTLSVNPSSLTIVAGQTGQATFTVTPENGFNSQVAFACSNLPAEANCTFNPPNVTPDGVDAITSTLTISTTAPSSSQLQSSTRGRFYAFLLPGFTLVIGSFVRRKDLRRGLPIVVLATLLTLAFALISCSSSKSTTKTGGTPPGTTTVTVTAATSGSGAISQTANLTITITQ